MNPDGSFIDACPDDVGRCPWTRDKLPRLHRPDRRARSSRTSSGSSPPTGTSGTPTGTSASTDGPQTALTLKQISNRPLPGQAELADQPQAQARGATSTTTSTRTDNGLGHRLDAHHGLVAPGKTPTPGPRLHGRALQQDGRWTSAISGFYGEVTGVPTDPDQARDLHPVLRPRHRLSSAAGTTTGTSSSPRAPRSRPRSPTWPTTSWGRATTSSSACSTATRWPQGLYGLQRLRLHLQLRDRPQLRLRRTPARPSATAATAATSGSSSTTPSG